MSDDEDGGERITLSGTLVRIAGGFALRADDGGVVALDLARVPVDHVEKHVTLSGVRASDGRVEVDAIAAG